MRPFIVTADGFDTELFSILTGVDGLEVHPQKKVTQGELKELLPRIHGLIIRSATTVNEELLELAPQLKYVIRAGEGTDNIDKAACQKRGVKVSNTPGANNNSAAEHAIALMLSLLRKTPWAHQSMSEGRWDKALFSGNELSGKTIGILGLGRIGQIVAKRLQGFDPQILFYDPFVSESPLGKKVDLETLFKESDIVTLHSPLTPETKNLVTKKVLDLMPKHAILVNAARGGIVNQDDLYQHLKDKKIRGAAFDVFAQEPLEENSPLRQLDNMILTPHLGATTDEAQFRVGEMVIHQLKEFFLQNNLLNEVKA